MRTVTLKAGHAKPLWQGHPWVFASSIADAGEGDADWVRVVDGEGRVVGRGLLSASSAIRVRLISRRDDEGPAPVEEILARRIEAAAALRTRLFPDSTDTNTYRLIHAEADGLPGLVVDRHGDWLVAQWGTHPIWSRRERLAQVLLATTGARGLVSRAAGHEAKEGIPADGPMYRAGDRPPADVEVCERGMRLLVRPEAGQKTGHYADQRENRVVVSQYAEGADVLDLFAGGAGFAIQALRAGAATAKAVDSAKQSVALATANAALNGVGDHLEAVRGDVTEVLSAERDAGREYGLVVVDPPNLIPTSGARGRAQKPWRELLVRSFTRVRAGGFLAAFSCTPRMDGAALRALCHSASRDCRRSFRVLHELGAGPDHPTLPAIETSRYLAGVILQVQPW